MVKFVQDIGFGLAFGLGFMIAWGVGALIARLFAEGSAIGW